MAERIGIIGGTFNPIHFAHLIIAETFYYQLKLDKCFFVPAYISPFKKNATDELISTEHILNMLKSVFADNPKFEIDTFEINKTEISYTIHTIEYFSNKFEGENLYLLIGDDQASQFQKWKDWEKIIELTQLCVARRKINITKKEIDEINKTLSNNSKTIIWLENPLLEISSETIRYRIKNNIPIKYLVPKEIERYIYQNNLYL